MKNNSTLEKILLVERRAVAVSRSNLLFQRAFSQKDDEEKFDHSEKFAEKKAFAYGHFLFYFFCRC